MKKYMIGVIVGAILMFSGQAFAAQIDSLLGKKVQAEYTVIVQGKKLDSNAVNINGNSYISANDIAEATGYFVQFKDKSIIINKKEIKLGEPPLEPEQTPTP